MVGQAYDNSYRYFHLKGEKISGENEALFPLFVLFSPNWHCFCWYKILKNFVGLLCVSQQFTPLDKKLLLKSFMDNLIFIPGFCLHG